MPNSISTQHAAKRFGTTRKQLWAMLKQHDAAHKDGEGYWRVSPAWRDNGWAVERSRNHFHPALQRWTQYITIELTSTGMAHLYDLMQQERAA